MLFSPPLEIPSKFMQCLVQMKISGRYFPILERIIKEKQHLQNSDLLSISQFHQTKVYLDYFSNFKVKENILERHNTFNKYVKNIFIYNLLTLFFKFVTEQNIHTNSLDRY